MIKHVQFKERKKALQIAPKRSAVIPTLQKDPPLSHKGVDRFLPFLVCLNPIQMSNRKYPTKKRNKEEEAN